MPTPPSARIVIVDDEVAQMKALCETLRDQGYETAGFTGGRAALDALHDARFDLLLADLAMPEMDGIALLQDALETDPNLIGIIMTGEGTITTAVEAMKHGAVDYVLKPFRLSVILPVLARALDIRRLRMTNADLSRQLRAHAAELEAANKELDAFSYSVSHDLRAPLRAISGFAGFLAKDTRPHMPADAQDNLDRITANATRMERLIDDLLRFAQLGRAPLTKRHVSVAALVREAVEALQREHGDRDVEVRVGDLPDAVGDASLLRQVWFNLLSNAFKFTRGREHAVIEVGCGQPADGIYFVRDNGAGFEMRYAQRLFGVFQRMHRADEFEGTGVGLSIVERVILRHGGRVWAEAERDKGATFFFTLAG